MKNRFVLILITILLFSCENHSTKSEKNAAKKPNDSIKIIETNNTLNNDDFYIIDRLPDWFLETKLLNGDKLKSDYIIDNRLNPFYLEADFNGDGNMDIALPIKEIKTDKVGFAIIHGKTNEIFIIGAETEVKNGLSDDMAYIDIWKINREKINPPGVEEDTGNGKNGELILENPSLEILKSEVGGGLIYWNGINYSYFHQTC